jgi:hypothetical protein
MPLQWPPFPSLCAIFGTAQSGPGRAAFARRSEPWTARTVLEHGNEGKGGAEFTSRANLARPCERTWDKRERRRVARRVNCTNPCGVPGRRQPRIAIDWHQLQSADSALLACICGISLAVVTITVGVLAAQADSQNSVFSLESSQYVPRAIKLPFAFGGFDQIRGFRNHLELNEWNNVMQ